MSPIVVEGRMVSPTQIELEHPVQILEGAVEVEIRPLKENDREAVRKLLERMAAFPPRNRSKEEIDRQIQEEREGWEHRR